MAATASGKSLHFCSSQDSLSFSHITITTTKTHQLKFKQKNKKKDLFSPQFSSFPLTDVAGILRDREDLGSLVEEIDTNGAKKIIEDGKMGGGMILRVNCCSRPHAQGVNTPSIIDGHVEHSILQEIMTVEGAKTIITGSTK